MVQCSFLSWPGILLALASIATTASSSQEVFKKASQLPKAVYFMSNGDHHNSIHALPVGARGTVSHGTVTSTHGNGSRAPAASLTDALNSQGSLRTLGNYIFACNAGSNTVSMLKIDPQDPSNLTMVGEPVDTLGDWPNTIAVSGTINIACVGNSGTRAGVACFKITPSGLKPLDQTQRVLKLNPTQSTPPDGPFNTVSQTFFNEDLTGLITMVKGNPTAKKPTVGYLSYFPINASGKVSRIGTNSSPNGTAVLFGSVALPDNKIMATDASFGAALLQVNPKTYEAMTLFKHTIPNQGATCWAALSPATGLVYTTDDGTNQVGAFDPTNGHSVALTELNNGDANLIELSAVGDMLYALSHGNATSVPRIVVLKTEGAGGGVTQVQNFAPGKGKLTINVDGLALYI